MCRFFGVSRSGYYAWLKRKDTPDRDQYLAKKIKQIYTAFRAVPSLFGLPTASGFSTEEYEEAFKLYNRTTVRPIQRMIADAYDKIYGQKGVLNITPFTLDGTTETTVN